MNTKLIISICLVLVSMMGVGCVSAVDNQTSVQTNVEEMNVEMANEGNLIQTQSESANQIEKSVNMIGSSERNFINGNGPFHNGIKDHSNIKHNQTIKVGVNDTNQSNNQNKNNTVTEVTKRVHNDSNHNGTLKENKPVGIANLSNIEGPKDNGLKLLNKTKTFDYKGEKVYLAVMQNGSNRKLCMFKASGSGMGGATSSYVGEVGTKIVQILEEQGVISWVAYGCAWLTVKTTFMVMSWFDEDVSRYNQQFLINYLAFGTNTSKYIWD